MSYGLPKHYDYINLYNSQIDPSTIHVDSTLKYFFEKYLLEKVMSVFEFTIPENWDRAYYQFCQFCLGFIGVINTDKYGVICQHGLPKGRGIFYQPTNFVISNPLLQGIKEPRIDVECSVIKLQPSWTGVMDLVNYYASMMALSAESASVNLINSKLAYVFIAESKNHAESFKQMFDEINVNPAVFADKKLFNDDGTPRWQLFNTNVRQNFIANEILEGLVMWEQRFNTAIGIPNVKFEKAERLTNAEVNKNDAETKALVELWLETLKDGINKTNELFGINMDVQLRFDKVQDISIDNAFAMEV